MACAVIDLQTLLVLNIIVADETDKPHAGTLLKATPAADGSQACVGEHWLESGSFEQTIIDAPIPWP